MKKLKLIAVCGKKAGKWQGKVVAESHIRKRFFINRGSGKGCIEFISALKYLKNQIEVVAAIALIKIFCIFKHRSRNAFKA